MEKVKALHDACVEAEQWDWAAAVSEELASRKMPKENGNGHK